MFRVTIRPQWQLQAPDGDTVVQRLIDLLVGIHEGGSLAALVGILRAQHGDEQIERRALRLLDQLARLVRLRALDPAGRHRRHGEVPAPPREIV